MSDMYPPKELFLKAENFEKNGLLKNALASYEFILHSYPHTISAYIARGMIFEYKRMYILAADSYKLASKIEPNDVFLSKRLQEIPQKIACEEKEGFYLGCNISQERLIDMARLEMQYGTISKARFFFRKIRQGGVAVPYAKAMLKYITLSKRRIKLTLGEVIFKLREDYDTIYTSCNVQQIKLLSLAMQGDGLGNVNEVKKRYEEILKMNDAVPYVNVMLGGIEFNDGNYESALIYLNRAIELKPHSPNAIEFRGECKENLCRLKDAVQDYDLAIKLKPDLAKAHYRKGLIFLHEATLLRKKEYYHHAYNCIKKAYYYGGEEFEKYFCYFRKKMKYLKKQFF